MNINLVFNKEIENYKEALEVIETVLISKKIGFKSFDINHMENFGDFTLVIGGDGTLLKVLKFYSEFNIPVLGVNLGRLGFLSQTDLNEISDAIDDILDGKYSVEERLMLTSDEQVALNDFVIKGCNPSRTSKFFLEIDGNQVCDYIADGLIVSTPTGSTAYGLSAGGPIVHPTLDAIVIVPICPHTLNVRPLVIPSTEIVTIKTGDKLLSVAIDGFDTAQCVDKIKIKVSPHKAKLAFLANDSFYSVLRNKLHWGISLTSK